MTITQPPALSSGERATVRGVIVTAAVLFGVAVLTSLTVFAVGVGRARIIADAQPLPADLRMLTIDAGDVPMAIRIRTDDDATEPRVEMRFVSTAGHRQALDITTAADTARITLRGETPHWFRWARGGELKVVLPPGVSQGLTLTTTQRYGALMVDTDLTRLEARTDNGAVDLRGAAGTVEIHSLRGAIRSRAPIAVRDSFSATGVEGRISVDFQDPPPPRIRATLDEGQVELGLDGDGPFLVQAGTGDSGDRAVVRVPRTANPAEAVSEVTARVGSGSVIVAART
ncbi:hypothetical protein [[Mycobacterium] wendilense]|uniref:Adhesin domain-containing protein n=1 Tax=[Mycobacterium] wendilense TaxID=3064284 RepID=A0ABN9NVY0_9MYCO|nr:hypothetical protein [Mycolicibacterium sp. MU0050]CAJ1580888.1 hypothetical protein MU0050_001258 [Mycolicibacterium sp. MU0050]